MFTRVRSTAISLFSHRSVVYLVLFAAIVAALGLGSTAMAQPVQASTATVSSAAPAALAAATQQNCWTDATNALAPACWERKAVAATDPSDAGRYLTFMRWRDVTGTPVPGVNVADGNSLVTVGMSVVSRIALTVGSLLTFALGFLMMQVVRFDVFDRIIYSVDYIFAIFGRAMLGIADGTNQIGSDRSISSVSIAALLLILLFGSVLFRAMTDFKGAIGRSSGSKGLIPAVRQFGMGLLSFTALFLMTSQAASNHSEFQTPKRSAVANQSVASSLVAPSDANQPVNDNSNGGTGSNGPAAGASIDMSDPSNWASLSPGWIVAHLRGVTEELSQVVISVTNSVSKSLESVNPNKNTSSACYTYVEAMHTVFQTTGYSKGISSGGQGMLESYDNLANAVYFNTYALSAAGDSRGADNAWCRLAEIQANQPAGDQVLLSIISGSVNPVTSRLVDGKEWKGGDAKKAQLLFGPSFSEQDSGENTDEASPSLTARAAAFWAACDFKDNRTTLNPEWRYVVKASEKDANSTNYLDKDGADCTEVIDDAAMLTGNAANDFDYKEQGSKTKTLFGILGISTSSTLQRFAGAPVSSTTGTSPALQYYKTTQGLNSNITALYAVIAAAGAFLMAKFTLPLLVGGIMAQFMSAFSFFAIPVLLTAMILPFKKVRRAFHGVCKTILFGFVVSIIFVSLLNFMIVVVKLNMAIIVDPNGSALAQVIQTALAMLIGFYCIRMLAQQFLGLDLGRVRDTAKKSFMFMAKDTAFGRNARKEDMLLGNLQQGQQQKGASAWRTMTNRARNRTLGAINDQQGLRRRKQADKAEAKMASAQSAQASRGNGKRDAVFNKSGASNAEVAKRQGRAGALAADQAAGVTSSKATKVAAAVGNAALKANSFTPKGIAKQVAKDAAKSGGIKAARAAGTGAFKAARTGAGVIGAAGSGAAGAFVGLAGMGRYRTLEGGLTAGVMSGFDRGTSAADRTADVTKAVGAKAARIGKTAYTLAAPVGDVAALAGSIYTGNAAGAVIASAGLISSVNDIRALHEKQRDPQGIPNAPALAEKVTPANFARTAEAARIGGVLPAAGVRPNARGAALRYEAIDQRGLQAAAEPQFNKSGRLAAIGTLSNNFADRQGLSRTEWNKLPLSDRTLITNGDLNAIPQDSPLESGRMLSTERPAPGMIYDAKRQMFVPESVVRQGTPAAYQGQLTQGQHFLLGAEQQENGTWRPEPVRTARVNTSGVLSAPEPPRAGISQVNWESFQDSVRTLRTNGVSDEAIPQTLRAMQPQASKDNSQFGEIYAATYGSIADVNEVSSTFARGIERSPEVRSDVRAEMRSLSARRRDLESDLADQGTHSVPAPRVARIESSQLGSDAMQPEDFNRPGRIESQPSLDEIRAPRRERIEAETSMPEVRSSRRESVEIEPAASPVVAARQDRVELEPSATEMSHSEISSSLLDLGDRPARTRGDAARELEQSRAVADIAPESYSRWDADREVQPAPAMRADGGAPIPQQRQAALDPALIEQARESIRQEESQQVSQIVQHMSQTVSDRQMSLGSSKGFDHDDVVLQQSVKVLFDGHSSFMAPGTTQREVLSELRDIMETYRSEGHTDALDRTMRDYAANIGESRARTRYPDESRDRVEAQPQPQPEQVVPVARVEVAPVSANLGRRVLESLGDTKGQGGASPAGAADGKPARKSRRRAPRSSVEQLFDDE